jgi:hypothetical protein
LSLEHRAIKNTKREQFHSNVIGSAVNLFRNSTRERLADLASYFLTHGVSDAAAAQQKAIVAIGNIVRKRALIMGNADTLAALALLLVLAAASLLFTRPAGQIAPPRTNTASVRYGPILLAHCWPRWATSIRVASSIEPDSQRHASS